MQKFIDLLAELTDEEKEGEYRKLKSIVEIKKKRRIQKAS